MEFSNLPKLVINLPERTDRLDQVVKELSGYDFTIIPGVRNIKPMLGIAEAHLNCIRHAKENNFENVLIMEDDFLIRKGGIGYLNQALKNLPEEWDVLLGGLYEGRPQKYNDYWNKVGEFCGLHFYIVNHKFYDTILTYEGIHHIDRWMNHRGNRGKVFVTKKLISTQSNGFSDNVNKRVDYSDKIKRFELL